MSPNLFLTADVVGTQTGGGSVTFHEQDALRSLGWCETVHPDRDSPAAGNPFWQDRNVLEKVKALWARLQQNPQGCEFFKLAHCYAGCLSETVAWLRKGGCKVTYTAAAHDVQASRDEHLALGVGFNYPHLTDPDQWKQYLDGYLGADVLIVPSTHSRDVMVRYGASPGRVRVIPHGVADEAPPVTAPPAEFTVGYLGALGPDKGVQYLLRAWSELGYKDSVLVIGGPQSTSPWAYHLVERYGKGGRVRLAGWFDDVKDFYNGITLYVQPSVTEGYGMEVTEAMHHGRPVLCSTGAGACDQVFSLWTFEPSDVDEMKRKIDVARAACTGRPLDWWKLWQQKARAYPWGRVRGMYQEVWKELLA